MYKESTGPEAAARLAKNLPQRKYRPELHGVRGLAILGVVLFHLFGDGRVSGGIDIFLTISGFLFTAMLLREVTENAGLINLARYFGRLFRRIVVPAVIVIVATVAAGLIIFPFPQHGQIWTEAFASLLYFENIELIRSHLAYEAASQDVSPFQHFWSLSIQGQFYLVLPFVAFFAYWLAKRLKTSSTRVMGWILAAVLVASLAFAIYVSSYAQDEAYLMTRTRVWQFAFGGLLAIVIDRVHFSNKTRLVLGYLGLVSIVAVGFLINGAQLFPGPWALWPLLAFAFVLLAAPDTAEHNSAIRSAPRVLSNRFFGWVGDHAYGLYLWHWPLLIFYLAVRDREAVGIRGAVVIFAATVVLSMLMYRFIEKPLDRLGKEKRGPRLDWISLGAGATAVAVGAVAAFSQLPSDGNRMTSAVDFDTQTHPGALSVSDDFPVPEAEFIPELAELHREHPAYTFRDCQQTMGQGPGTDTVEVCDDPEAPDEPTATVALSAGSHAGQWEAAVRAIGKEYGWEVLVVTKSACTLEDHNIVGRSMCQSWNENFIEWLDEHEIDLVMTPGTRVNGEQSNESIREGAPNRWQQIRDLDVDLLLLRGTPRPGDNGGPCLQKGGTAEECGVVAGDIATPGPLETMDLPDGTQTIDMNPYICPTLDEGESAWCDSVIGNIIVWYDGSHLTQEYVYSMAPAFEREMHKVFPDYLN